MYTRAYWEDVNSIKTSCTSVIDPNLKLYCFKSMYIDVQRWTIITDLKQERREDCCPHALFVAAVIRSLTYPLVEVRCWSFIHCCREASA
jgi:hypothetical protein